MTRVRKTHPSEKHHSSVILETTIKYLEYHLVRSILSRLKMHKTTKEMVLRFRISTHKQTIE